MMLKKKTMTMVLSAAVFTCLLAATTGVPADAARPETKRVTLHGSWAGRKIAEQLAAEFHHSAKSLAVVDFMPRDSAQIPSILRKNQCDVGLVLDSLAPQTAKTLDERFLAFPLGRFSVGVVVNAKIRTRSVTAERLGNVFQGGITSWSDVTATNAAGQIELFAPLVALTESHIFRHGVMSDRFAPPILDRSTKPSRQKLSSAEIVGAVIENRNAIGFFLLGPDTIVDERIRLLPIARDEQTKAVGPTLETIAEGSYPITDQLTFYLHPDAPSEARAFVEFATGPEGAKIARQHGLWPDRDIQKHLGEVRVKQMRDGKGVAVAAAGDRDTADVMQKLAVEFVRAKTTIQLRYRTASPGEGPGSMNAGAELLLSDRPLPNETASQSEDQRLAQAPVLGYRAVAVVVHPDNPLAGLSVDELRDIYSGKVARWPEQSHKIQLFGLPRAHRAARLFEAEVVGPKTAAKLARRPTTAKVIEAVAREPAAIGFVDAAELHPKESLVNVVGLLPPGGTRPLAANREQVPPDYPLARAIRVYVAPDASEAARDLARFITSDDCRAMLPEHDLIPPSPER